MAISFQHPIYNCNLAQEQYDSGFFSINAYHHVITKYAQYGVLIYCEMTGTSVFYPDHFEYVYDSYNNRYRFRFTNTYGNSGYPTTVYLVSYRPRTVTFVNGGSYTLNNSERKLVINGYNFYYNDTNLANNFPNHFISICFEEWYYENLTAAQYSNTYSTSRFPIIKYFIGTTTYYMINNGSTISSQIPSGATHVAVLSGSGNLLLRLESNWLQRRDLNKTNTAYDGYFMLGDTITGGYLLQDSTVQLMDPFESQYATDNVLNSYYHMERDSKNKKQLREPHGPSLANPKILYNSFFDNRPSFQLTKTNFKSNVFWIDNYLLYFCGVLYQVPSDCKMGIYFSEPRYSPTVVWDYNYSTPVISLNMGSFTEIRMNLTGYQEVSAENVINFLSLNKDNTLTNNTDLHSNVATYFLKVYCPGNITNYITYTSDWGGIQRLWASAGNYLTTTSNLNFCRFSCIYNYPSILSKKEYADAYIDRNNTISRGGQKLSDYGDITSRTNITGTVANGIQTMAGISLSWKSPILNGIYRQGYYTRDTESRKIYNDGYYENWPYYGDDGEVNGNWSAHYYTCHEVNLTNQWEEAVCVILY